MGKVTTVAEEMKHVSDVLKRDYPQSKEYNPGRFKTIEEETEKAIGKIQGTLDVTERNFHISNDRFNVVNVQLASLKQTFGSLSQHVAELQAKLANTSQPQQFAISSPLRDPGSCTSFPYLWSAARRSPVQCSVECSSRSPDRCPC